MSGDNWGTEAASDSWGEDAAGATAEQSLDTFEFDAGDADPEKIGGRGTVDKAGKYHFEIIDVKPDLATVSDNGNPKTPSVNFTLRVLESAPGQSPAGSLAWHRLYVGEKGGGPPKQGSFDAMIDFMVAIGRLKKVTEGGVTKFVNPDTGTAKFTLQHLVVAKGDQFVGHMKREQKKDAHGNKIDDYEIRLPFSGGTFRLDDRSVSDVPKNRDAAELWSPFTKDRGTVGCPDANAAAEKPKRGGGRKKAEEPAPGAPAFVASANPAPVATTPTPAPPVNTTPPAATPAAPVVDEDF